MKVIKLVFVDKDYKCIFVKIHLFICLPRNNSCEYFANIFRQ